MNKDLISDGAKITIENEYRHKVAEFRKKRFDIPMTQANQWKSGAEYGYSLCSKEPSEAKAEIERLKGLIESLHTDAFGIAPHKWLEYKKQNNL